MAGKVLMSFLRLENDLCEESWTVFDGWWSNIGSCVVVSRLVERLTSGLRLRFSLIAFG